MLYNPLTYREHNMTRGRTSTISSTNLDTIIDILSCIGFVNRSQTILRTLCNTHYKYSHTSRSAAVTNMDTPDTVRTPTSEAGPDARPHHVSIPNLPSAASSLRRLYLDHMANGLKTPATPDERTALLASPQAAGGDLEGGIGPKQSGPSGEYFRQHETPWIPFGAYMRNSRVDIPPNHRSPYRTTSASQIITLAKDQILYTINCLDTRIFTVSVRVFDLFTGCWFLSCMRVAVFRLGGDVLGGLTVASMLIPQSVSYASSLAKLSPVTGLVCLSRILPKKFSY